ncbi:substrate-binding periplasmic protein [Chitinimonas sp.]|uniref:substrate-binding periplasmic protein n=1 Tax=Chitinimonas sp. TaxID=1934313 RepID=UPI002F94153B
MRCKLAGWAAAWLLAVSLQAGAGDALLVVGDNAPPFRIFEGDRCSGIYCDALLEIGRRTGLHFRFAETPGARALMMMQYDQADIMLGPNKTPERERYLVFLTTAFPAARKVFYQRPESSPIKHYADLTGQLVSVERGKQFFDPFDHDPAIRRDIVSDSLTALRKVAAGRSDAALLPEWEGDWLLRQQPLMLVKAPYFAEGRLSYIALSRRADQGTTRATIDKAFGELQKDGTLQHIIEKYR